MLARAAASECRPPELVTAKREEPPACAERTADRPGPRGRGSGRLPLSHSLLPDCDVDLATGPSQSVDPPWNDFTAALDHVIDDGLSQEHNTARRDEILVLRDSATGGAARNQYVLKVGETGRAFAFGNLERLRKVLARRDGPQLVRSSLPPPSL